jgi:subtilisin family serine protease
MRRAIQLLALGVCFVFAGILAFDALGQQPDPPDQYVPGQIIVKIRESTPPQSPSGPLSIINATVIRRFESTGAELWSIGDITVEEAVVLLESNPLVEYVEPDYIWRAVTTFPNDPNFTQLWGLHNTGQTGGTPDADVDAPEAWDIETGDSVLVGVIDTGVDWNHADLSENIYVNPGEIPDNNIDDDLNGYVDDVRGWDFVNNDNNPMDDNGHGTHVSGTVAAVGNNGIGVAGVSWRAKILPIKFLNSYGSGSTSNAIRSVEYATLMGVRLTNNSWGGGPFSTALRDAIDAAGAAGQLFVAAAGNDGANTDIYTHYPSSYDLDNIVSVANTNHNDQLNFLSNWGLVSVDLGAPGTDILSTRPGNSYGYGSGTSMAAPHVSGAVSLIWAAAPTMSGIGVKELLLSSVDAIPALDGKSVSGGRLNVFRVISQLDSIPPAPVTDLAVVSTGSNTATLSWTATGDDSTTGTAAAYDLRYSDSGIYWSNFDEAIPVADPPTPQPSGALETFMVQGLDFNTTYYFAMKVSDDRGNVSWLSNLPNGVTLGIPHLMFSPDSLHDHLFTGGTSTHTLTIANNAEGTLDFVFSGLPTWLVVHPANGRVYEGESMDIEMIYDATRLSGGDYAAGIILETNDPSQPLTTIAVTLEVTDAPDVSVSKDALDYGPHYTGTSATDTVEVTNIGTESLVVSGIGIDNPEFSAAASGFALDPGDSHVIEVSFNPISEGVIQGTLAIQSNDPDHPTLAVALRGQGVPPPVISVTPDSLADNLFTGGTSTHTLTIDNTGGSNLEFEIEIEETEAVASVNTRILVQRSSTDFPRGTHAPSAGLVPVRDAREDDRDPFEGSRAGAAALPFGGSAFATETEFRFATRFNLSVPEVLPNIGPFTNTIWAGDFGAGDNAFAYAITDFNQLVKIDTLDGAQTPLGTIVPYGGENWSGAALDPTDGQFYATSTNVYGSSLYRIDVDAVTATRVGSIGFDGIIAVAVDDLGDMYAHDIVTDQLVSIDKTTGVGTGIGSLGFDANFGQGMAFDPVSGELYLAAFNNYTFQPELRIADRSTGATVLVGVLGSSDPGGIVQLGWVGIPGLGGALWLAVDPLGGIVPPGASMELSVTFDAARLADEDLNANILVSSNDPFTPEVTVPAHLHTTAAPHIVLSATSLDFGEVFVGAVVESTLSVSNHGAESLTVMILAPSHPDFSVDVTNFTLNPTESRDVGVSFAPSQVAPISATLTINSNDSDEPMVTVALTGEGVEPPVISVNPEALSDSLFTGEMATHTVTIDNTGGSDLLFELSIAAADSGTTAAMSVEQAVVLVIQRSGVLSGEIRKTSHNADVDGIAERVYTSPVSSLRWVLRAEAWTCRTSF